ncbi:cytochrome P450 [Acrasis kona]|uniref:Cytochrome P450 n=1 Tax=Acrasis kona TaxID=1008807 RepID=A0AAW2ZM19_9EUKA
MLTGILLVLVTVILLLLGILYNVQKKALSRIHVQEGSFKDYINIFTAIKKLILANVTKEERAKLAKRQLEQAVAFDFKPYLTFFVYNPVVVINDPEGARRVLLNSKSFEKNTGLMKAVPHAQQFVGDNVVLTNGELWRQQRSIMDPAFYNIERFSSVFAEKAKDCLDAMLKKSTTNNMKVTVPTFMTSFALDVLGRTVFGIPFDYISDALARDGNKTNAQRKESNKKNIPTDEPSSDLSFLETYHYVLSNAFTIVKFLGGSAYSKIPTSSNLEYEKEIEKFDSLIYYVIKQAKKRREKGFDADYTPTLLDMMVDSVDDLTGQGMTERELRDNVVVFFVAGHDTTASALSSALYVIGKHADVQERLVKEISEKVGMNNVPTFEQIESLDYLRMFLKENLRMYPPVTSVLGRILNKDESIGSMNLKKGQAVQVSVYSIHNNPHVWKNPEEFRPERFSEEEKKGRSSFAWIPFGGGPRTCIGNNFSLLEQKIFLINMLQRFVVSLPDPNYVLKTSTVAGILSAPDENLQVTLTKRSA